MQEGAIRTRFAPSPTGLLHIGGARTALFNWLFARHHNGAFILRIEDTDAVRNTQEATEVILNGLRWLGLNWDEGPEIGGSYGPYFQSQRKEIHAYYLDVLLSKGAAYKDTDGTVRFPLPKEPITVHDLICGSPTFELKNEPDITLRRADGTYTFHFVNVVDDYTMRITHVIRGEDHLSNTPKHIALYRALEVEPPQFAHIPLILNPDIKDAKGNILKHGSKMSKRDKGASLQEYIDEGYVPQAVVNYLCLLGWSPRDNTEKFPISLAIEKFDLSHVNRTNAHFDINKLFWLNGEWLRSLNTQQLRDFALPILRKAGLVDNNTDTTRLDAALALVREKIKLGRDLPDWCSYLLKDDYPIDPQAADLHLNTPQAKENLRTLRDAFAQLSTWDCATLEQTLKQLALQRNLKVGALVHPCRVALTGKTVGPSLYHMLEFFGKNESLRRIDRCIS